MRFVTKFLALLPLSLTLFACDNVLDLGGSGDDDNAPAPTSPAPPNASGEPATTPTSPSTTKEYCSSRTSFTSKCSSSMGKCELERSAKCDGTFSVYRPEYLQALVKCDFPAACPVAPSSSITTDDIDNCVSDEQDKIEPTDAQKDLANAVCDVCPNLHAPNGTCLDNFWKHGRRLPNGGVTVGGSGTSFDRYNDAVIAKLRLECGSKEYLTVATSSGASCWPAFYSCIDNRIAKEQPPSVKDACAINAVAPNQ